MRNLLLAIGAIVCVGVVIVAMTLSLSDPDAPTRSEPDRPDLAPSAPGIDDPGAPDPWTATAFSGQVTRNDGAFLEGATVTFHAFAEETGLSAPKSAPFTEVRTDHRGRFAVPEMPAGAWVVEAALPGFSPAYAIVRSFDGETPIHPVLRLVPNGALAGRVVTHADDPVPGSVLSLVPSRVTRAVFEREKTLGRLRPRLSVEVEGDEEGRFEFPDLPRGAYDVTVTAPGMVTSVLHTVRVPTVDLEVVLRRGITLRGTVTWPGNFEPATLRLKLLPRGPTADVTVGDKGASFEFTDVAPGVWVVTAYGSGTTNPEVEVELDEGKAPPDIHLHLESAAVMSGRVLDIDSGRAVPGAEVSFERNGETRTTHADANGRYRIGLSPGEWQGAADVTEFHRPKQSGRTRLFGDRGPGQVSMGTTDQSMDFKLRANCDIVGRVLYPDGSPAKAHVRIREAVPIRGRKRSVHAPRLVGRRARTSADGSYVIRNVVTWSMYVVEARGQGEDNSALARELVFEEGKRRIRVPDLVVQRPKLTDDEAEESIGAGIRGRLVSGAGKPIPCAVVAVDGVVATADVEGRFEVPDVHPGVWRPVVIATGFPPRELEAVKCRPGGAVDLGDIVLPDRGVHLSARVLDNGAQPVPWARASVRFQDVPEVIDVTADFFGRFELEGPSAHRGVEFRIDVNATGFAPGRVSDMIVTERVVDVVLERFASLFVTLRLSKNLPRRLSVTLRESHLRPWRTVTARQVGTGKSYTSDEVPIGTFVVRVSVPGFAEALLGSHVFRAGRKTNLGTVDVQLGGTVYGKVSVGGRSAGTGLRVWIPEIGRTTYTKGNGTFRMDHVPPGLWTLHVFSAGKSNHSASTTVTVKDRGKSKVSLKLP